MSAHLSPMDSGRENERKGNGYIVSSKSLSLLHTKLEDLPMSHVT
jgi:hypothetical protein